ncbi:MAG TPA: tetratricopeptide repeat protein [Chloroflexi bacterium]|nr:tetratricopeptide repeat protein [Chloroflexota bacterium]
MWNRTKLDQWCDGALEAGWLAALVVAPLFFNVFSSRVFEPDKISLVRSIALAMIAVWLVKIANGGYAWLPAADASPEQQPPGGNWRGFVKNPFIWAVGLVILAFVLATVFSVAVFVSWFGSYQRLQGTYSFLAYVTIAGLTAATLRRPEQVRRFQHTVIVTSLAVSIYGVIQHYNLDPLPWGGDVTTRVAANAGNAIFLAAYLIMAFFLTLERVFTSFVRLMGIGQAANAETQDWQSSLAGGAYLFVLLVQAIAIFWTQSRGPWLGWVPGIFLFVLLTVSAVRPRYFRALLGAAIGGVLAIVVLIFAANYVPGLSFLQQMPFVGRLATVLQTEGGTAEVRTLIWGGAAEMLKPHAPLQFPDGSTDSANLLRPLVGYGPEAMWVAFNPFYPPALAQIEARNASPDRSHNEAWDSIVITGLLGFIGYIALFVTIFYWALRWLGLIRGHRDSWLFGALVTAGGVIGSLALVATDGWQLRMAGVGLPFGIVTGFGAYTALAAFLHAGDKPDRADLPRLMMVIALLTAIVAHYLEIHFGIAIAATRTHFWVFTAVLMLVGMRLVSVVPSELVMAAPASLPEAPPAGKRSKSGKGAPAAPIRRPRVPNGAARLPRTVLTDVLVFLTFVYIYSTNAGGLADPLRILGESIFFNPKTGANSPAIFFLMVFTWLVAATIGLAEESLAQRRAPGVGWWLTGLGLHAAVVWGAWLIYGLIQAARLAPIPPPAGIDNQAFLNMQLERVGGHFGFFTFIVIAWIVAAGTIYVWPALRERTLPAVGRVWAAAGVGVAAMVLATFLVYTINVNLVKADIVYKQGQQFDSQGNWLSSIELYKRALATRKTEDHYMLFLGRALLEQAKQAPPAGAVTLPATLTLDDVLALTPDTVAQLGRTDLLCAAETVLLEAQRVNPLNTDHTANLARLYRTWADLVADDAAMREKMLAASIAMYNTAVTLSPNAAHLWNERGNAFLAAGQNDEALASFEHSLSLDKLFDQTYLLLADFFERTGQTDRLLDILNQGIELFGARGNAAVTGQLLSYLGVIEARRGNLDAAAAANQRLLELLPGNLQALRNLAIIARDQGNVEQAIAYAHEAIAAGRDVSPEELAGLHQLAAELYQQQGNTEALLRELEEVRRLLPNDVNTLRSLSSIYATQGNQTKALEMAQTLMALDPTNYQYMLDAGMALLKLARGPEALTLFQQAKALAPAEQQAAIDALIAQAGG